MKKLLLLTPFLILSFKKDTQKERTYTLNIPESQLKATYYMLHGKLGDLTNNETAAYQQYLPEIERQLTGQQRQFFIADSLNAIKKKP